jgi:anti-sigma B factor antagonist
MAASVTRGELTITTRVNDGRRAVALAGELDLAAAGVLREELEAADRDHVDSILVDLRDLRFVDSTGLSVLFEAVERANGNGRRITFTRSSPEVERTLRLTGLDQILEFDALSADGAPETPDRGAWGPSA